MPRRGRATWRQWFVSNKVGVTMATLGVGLVLIMIVLQPIFKNPATEISATFDSPSSAVRRAYIEFLGREPDPPGEAAYVRAITSGDLTIDRMREALKKSEEAQERRNKRNLALTALDGLCADRKSGNPVSSDRLASLVSNSHDIGVTKLTQEGKDISRVWEQQGNSCSCTLLCASPEGTRYPAYKLQCSE